MSKLKYVRGLMWDRAGTQGEYETALMWPESTGVAHATVGLLFREVTGAGFAFIADDAISAFGRSESLNIDSDPSDSGYLTKKFIYGI